MSRYVFVGYNLLDKNDFIRVLYKSKGYIY